MQARAWPRPVLQDLDFRKTPRRPGAFTAGPLAHPPHWDARPQHPQAPAGPLPSSPGSPRQHSTVRTFPWISCHASPPMAPLVTTAVTRRTACVRGGRAPLAAIHKRLCVCVWTSPQSRGARGTSCSCHHRPTVTQHCLSAPQWPLTELLVHARLRLGNRGVACLEWSTDKPTGRGDEVRSAGCWGQLEVAVTHSPSS